MNQPIIQKENQATRNSVSHFMNQVYLIMGLCLFLSSAMAYNVISHPGIAYQIITNQGLFLGLLAAQLVCVFAFRKVISRCSAVTTLSLLAFYSLLSGATLSVIVLAYTTDSIVQTLAICTASFIGLSIVGYVTKRDLSPIGSFCIMGLIGLIILLFASIIFPSLQANHIQLAISAAGVLIFSGLTAYDTQKIKSMYNPAAPKELQNKMVLAGALTLYLDFINLFIHLLRLLGRRR